MIGHCICLAGTNQLALIEDDVGGRFYLRVDLKIILNHQNVSKGQIHLSLLRLRSPAWESLYQILPHFKSSATPKIAQGPKRKQLWPHQ